MIKRFENAVYEGKSYNGGWEERQLLYDKEKIAAMKRVIYDWATEQVDDISADRKIGELEAKVLMYENIIEKSNFQPMLPEDVKQVYKDKRYEENKGTWIQDNRTNEPEEMRLICSKCYAPLPAVSFLGHITRPPFCQWCGSPMRTVEDDCLARYDIEMVEEWVKEVKKRIEQERCRIEEESDDNAEDREE